MTAVAASIPGLRWAVQRTHLHDDDPAARLAGLRAVHERNAPIPDKIQRLASELG